MKRVEVRAEIVAPQKATRVMNSQYEANWTQFRREIIFAHSPDLKVEIHGLTPTRVLF